MRRPTETQSPDPEVLVDLRLPPEPTSPAQARRALHPLEDRLDDDVLFTLRLLISELVTNSVRHARLSREQVIRVRVLFGPWSVRVEVLDDGWGFPLPDPRPPGPSWQYIGNRDLEWPGGWGLSILDSIADSWGIVRDDRTVVWFELTVDAGRGG
jgi:anti-sigma regulatory factor (Ser/Thr protein kinase)